MTKLTRGRISDDTVERLSVRRDTVFWDRDLPGFGVRVYPSGRKTYIVQMRTHGRSKRATIGPAGAITAAEARRSAALALTSAGGADRDPPRPAALTVAQLAARYMAEHVAVHCKPRTATFYRQILDTHIVPALGARPIAQIGRDEVAALHYRLHKTPSMANRVVEALSRMFNQAAAWGCAPSGGNPCRFVMKNRERRRERFLTEHEFFRIGRALNAAEAVGQMSPPAAAAIRLLMLTGCRRNEILTLRWADVSFERSELRLRDSKTGPRTVPLSPPALEVLESLPVAPDNPWVITGRMPGTHLRNLNTAWNRVRTRANLPDMRLHDLRHSWASHALALGVSLPAIGRLLGHSRVETTARYAHLARDNMKAAAARIAASIGADILAHGPPGNDPREESEYNSGIDDRGHCPRRRRSLWNHQSSCLANRTS